MRQSVSGRLMSRKRTDCQYWGWKTAQQEWVEFTFPKDAEQKDSIQKDLEGILFTANPRKTIYVMHTPPYETNLDLVRWKWHIGSMAVKMFIEERQPYLTLHGHIHETVAVSGSLSIKQEIHYLCLPETAIQRMIWHWLFLTCIILEMRNGLSFRMGQLAPVSFINNPLYHFSILGS